MATRLYIVEVGTDVKGIHAVSQASARNHALKDMASVRIASAKEAAELVSEGKKIETVE